AIDRVHRLNQTRDVVVYRLTVEDTVEERIVALQERKRELAKAAIEGGKAVGKLSMKDIVMLFRRDAEVGDVHEREEGGKWWQQGREKVLEARAVAPGQAKGVAPVRKVERERARVGGEDAVYGRRW
ncbi:hypothetical protein LTR66_012847, partial [Elasticomyces elasticus]